MTLPNLQYGQGQFDRSKTFIALTDSLAKREHTMTERIPCPFCQILHAPTSDRIRHQSEHGFVIRDGFPVSAGHSLVIPKRHVQSFFELSEAERTDLLALLDWAKADVDAEFKPDAFNIGINDGPAAILHSHRSKNKNN